MIPYNYGVWLESKEWYRVGDLSILNLFKDGYDSISINYYEDGTLLANFDLLSYPKCMELYVWDEDQLNMMSVADVTRHTMFKHMAGVAQNYKNTGHPKPSG